MDNTNNIVKLNNIVVKLTNDFELLKLKKRKNEDKTYLINSESREKLKKIQKKFIILIPKYSIIPEIVNESKKYFIYNTYFVTDLYDNLLFFEIDFNKNEEEIHLDIQKYLINNLGLKNIKKSIIKKILEVEEKKINVYSINLNKKIKSFNNFLNKNNKEWTKYKQNKYNNNLENLDSMNKIFIKKTTHCGLYTKKDFNKKNKSKCLKKYQLNHLFLNKLNKINIIDNVYIKLRNILAY